METFIAQLPNTLIGWLSMLVALGLSITLAYLAFRRQRDGSDDRLIKILQGTVEELEKKVTHLETEQEILVKKVNDLTATNDTLTKILQGRDEATVAFQREVMAAIKVANGTHELAVSTNQAVNRLVELLEKHIIR